MQWWAFFDVAAAINPSIRASVEIVERYREIKLSYRTQNVGEWYLHWVALENVIDLQAYGLEAPYEPAIRVLERGCKFRWGGGEMEVGIGSFRIS